MKKQLLLFLSFLCVLTTMFVSCEEVLEPGKYDNWQGRNEAFVDSLKSLNPIHVGNLETLDKVPVGKLFAILVPTNSTSEELQYVYCKKIVAQPDGIPPYQTSTVTTFYYGTLITGDKFDGNFVGHTALDKTPNTEVATKNPTPFDSPTNFAVANLISGWTWSLQYMRKGERWMIYIPNQSGYGVSGSGAIPGYSTLSFDIILEDIKY